MTDPITNCLPPDPKDVDRYGLDMAKRLCDMAIPIKQKQVGILAIPSSKVEQLLRDLDAKDRYITDLEAEIRVLRATGANADFAAKWREVRANVDQLIALAAAAVMTTIPRAREGSATDQTEPCAGAADNTALAGRSVTHSDGRN